MKTKISKFNIYLKKFVKSFYENHFEKVIEINQKYATPKMPQTPVVKFSLTALKIYLLGIVLLLLYKLVIIIKLF